MVELDVFSKRTELSKVRVSFFVEDMLRYILGSYYTYWHGLELSETKWKKILKKLTTKLEIAIRKNIRTDDIHFKKICWKLDRIREGIEQKMNTDPQIVVALFSLCFELIGDMPDNRSRKHANKEIYFDLKSKRSLHYLQSPWQKVRVILESAIYEPYKNHYSRDLIEDKYFGDFNFRAEPFINWFKSEYPESFARLF